MAKMMSSINDSLKVFIEKQHLFFVGTAAQDGRVNISPKGMDTLKVIGQNRVLWLNMTGSGNETAAHVLDINRMTLMWCSFEELPLLLRVYGSVKTIYRNNPAWEELASLFPNIPAARQIFDLTVESVQTSCGYGVPLFEFNGQRDRLEKWSEAKGADGLPKYWKERNMLSIDGKDTGMEVGS